MHELSILENIVDIAAYELKRSGGLSIETIELEIGTLSGVEPDALEFAWPEATRSSVLENTVKVIRYLPGKAKCRDCDLDFDLSHFYDNCPNCGSYYKDITQGKELNVKSLEISFPE
jgi:hydrogenase nickel incorporation protein HypA/HybF